MRASIIATGTLMVSVVACAAEPPVPRSPVEERAAVEMPADGARAPTRSVVSIAPEIRKACGIAEADAHFAFDSARVEASEHATLGKLVTCFTSGPLAKREMRLVGHADPRGEDEYNVALGGMRADGIKNFLVERGLSGEQVATTSRGEMDAKGTGEDSWAEDRRVDIRLAN
jgi:peptidoglycan-associated lipoprotein